MTAPLKPAGRTLAEFQPLKPAEQKLLDACRQGEFANISDKRPEAVNDDNVVRAAFLRFLALGGDEKNPVHEHGVQLFGAWIEGVLDMVAAKVPSNLGIMACYFEVAPKFLGTKIMGTLNLEGSQLPGLEGDRLSCDGSLYMRQGFSATGKVRLLRAQIGANFNCTAAKFDCKDANYALSAEGIVVGGTFFFRKLDNPVNGVSLVASHVGRLVDDADSWGERLNLNGFVYDSIGGGASTDAATRLAWLDKQNNAYAGLNENGGDFRPQPWRQLAKVLREMGHAEDARQVAIAFEHRLREANLIGQTPKHWGKFRSWVYRKVSRAGHWLFGVLTGYGYRPLRLLSWMFGVWLVCAMFYWYAAAGQGVFAPSNPLVFQNPAYAVCRPDYVVPATQLGNAAPPIIQGAGNWYLCEKLPEEYRVSVRWLILWM